MADKTHNDTETALTVLFDRFRSLTPKERNDELQALYAAILVSKAETGTVDPGDIFLINALQKSFGTSLRWEELLKGGDEGF